MTSPSTTTGQAVIDSRPRYVLLVVLAGGVLAGALIGLAITATATRGAVTSGPLVAVGLALSRSVLDGAAVVTVGMSLLPKLLVPEPAASVAAPLALARLIATVSSAVWLVAALVSMVLEVVDINVGEPFTIAAIGWYVRGAGAGQAHLVVACCAFVYLVVTVLALRRGEEVPAELRIAVAVFALLPLSTAGHAASGAQGLENLALVSIELHVIAAVSWTGGLLAVLLLLGLDRNLLAGALPRFSKLATVCVFLTAFTGLFDGWYELHRTPGILWYLALFTTRYGWVLIGKGACVAAAGLLGGYTRLRLLPKIVERRTTAVVTWTTVEIGILAEAFGLAAVLIRAPVVTG
ncbi:CopD family protein [Amycolatopsis taiwanensis]|uniref:CopD family protein n=1 Tax=Amycolatopsis taiwanensis TaxID=342230 RepID=UPI002555393C|nr:CopD family protein [Amycolatopsis taiwanensis]